MRGFILVDLMIVILIEGFETREEESRSGGTAICITGVAEVFP